MVCVGFTFLLFLLLMPYSNAKMDICLANDRNCFLLRLSDGDLNEMIRNVQWPNEWPFTVENFRRQDESNDQQFYKEPRLVHHIDEFAIRALKDYYSHTLEDGMSDMVEYR